MKKISCCRVCGQNVSKALAYHAEVEKMTKNPITGETTIFTIKGAICPECNQRCGYKTSKAKLKKFGGVKNEN